MITAIMIGAGNRGIGAYGAFAEKHPNQIRFVGIAEPDPIRRGYFAMKHGIEESYQFSDYETILKKDKFADACFICTQDTMHVVPATMAMEKKYHVFLEKPMAVTPKECISLGEIAEKNHVKLMIGHVLRYTAFFSRIKSIVSSGEIGALMTIQHNENVSYWHQAHSYVRGNWRNKDLCAPMILTKSCHDLDILNWLVDQEPVRIASFGDLSYFTKHNAPNGAPRYCLDGCPHENSCVYHAKRVYLSAPDWMKLPVSNDMSDEGLLTALKQGPYGRCVFQCDNNVVDHQVVAIEYQNSVTAVFTMTAFTHENTRTIKLMGTAGEIRGHMDKNEIEVYHFGDDKPNIIHLDSMDYGHSGGDYGIMMAFCQYIENGDHAKTASAIDSIQSHLLAFAAEEARLSGKVITLNDYLQSLSR